MSPIDRDVVHTGKIAARQLRQPGQIPANTKDRQNNCKRERERGIEEKKQKTRHNFVGAAPEQRKQKSGPKLASGTRR